MSTIQNVQQAEFGYRVSWADGSTSYVPRDHRRAELIRRWEVSGGVVDPGHPSLKEARASKLAEINARCDAELMPVMSRYPASERLSWDQQESEARAYLANPNAAAPLLSGIAAARGRDVADLAQAVLVKAEQFTALASAAIGKRQRLEDQIAAAKTAEEVAAISW